MLVHNCRKQSKKKKPIVKPLEFGQWLCKKNICSPNLGCILRHAVCRCHCCIHSEARYTGSSCSAMTQHYPNTSGAAAVWVKRPSFPVFVTALNGMQTRSSDENSVRPSIRLSVTRAQCDKTVKRSVQTVIPYERTFSVVF